MVKKQYQLNWFYKIWALVFQSTLGLLEIFSVPNPRSIKKNIYDRNVEKNIAITDVEVLIKLGYRYWFLADLYWNKNTIVKGYKSAWFYVLSAHCFKQASAFSLSADLYHFAGHQFRRWQSYERAMENYFQSAEILFKNDSGDEERRQFAHRSIQRAIGLSKEIGAEATLIQWMDDKQYYKIYTDQYKKQNIWD